MNSYGLQEFSVLVPKFFQLFSIHYSHQHQHEWVRCNPINMQMTVMVQV